jgi:hypothetical protein
MIALLENGLANVSGLSYASGKPGTLILSGPPGDDSPGLWQRHDQRESRPLVDWLRAELKLRPAVNRVLVVWRTVDPRLKACLQTLTGVPRDHHEFSLTLLFAGPLTNASDVANLLSEMHLDGDESPRTSILFLGSEDQQGSAIDEERRSGAVGDLVAMLAATGDDSFGWLGLESGTNTTAPRSFGLRRWGPSVHDLRRLVEHVGHDVLCVELSAPPSAGFDQNTLESAPGRRLEELRTFGVPLGVTSDSSQTARLSERVSALPAHPFTDWACPAWRRAASRDGDERIDGHVPDIYEIHRRLLEELPPLATAIRSNGHDFFTKCRKELRQEVGRATRLGDIAALLRHYFPAITKVRQQSPPSPRHSCTPADDPTLTTCVERYREGAQERLADLVLRLPTGPHLLALYSGAGLLLAGAGFAFAQAVAPALSAIPAAVGIGLGGGTWLWSRWQSRTVAQDMKDYFDEADRWLRDSFVAKLDWVCAKTQQTLEAQYIATGEALGRTLGRSFESVFREWQTVLRGPSRDGADEELRSLGIDGDTLEGIKERFRSLASDIVACALREELATVGRANLEPILDQMAGQVAECLADHPWCESEVKDDLIDCAGQRLSPTLCARIGLGALGTGLRKTFVLPTPYTDALLNDLSSIASRTAVDVTTVRARIRGPAAWLLSPALNHDDFVEALKTTQP